MFKLSRNKTGRPRKKRGFNYNKKDNQNDNYMKTVVLNIRVSESEKNYLKNTTKLKSSNISSYIRRLIFDVYFQKLKANEIPIIHSLGNGEYAFNDKRNSYIYIRLTEVEKMELENLALMYHRNISEFVRWVSIQIPTDELIDC